MKVGSLFSGAGGFDLAAQLADPDYEIEWQVEIDPYCRSVLRRKFPGVPLFKDVCDVGRSNLSRVDLICGGFPCTDISHAGGRRGLAGKRSGLWWEFHRIISRVAPRWVVFENVPGLLSCGTPPGGDLALIVSGLEELGYGWSYRIYDSKYFGVAQRRRRIFLVAHIGGECPPEVLLESASLCGDSPQSETKEQDAPEGTGNSTEGVCGDLVYWDGSDLSDTLDVSSLVKGQMMPEKRRFPVVMDRAAFNQGENAKWDVSIKEEDSSPSLVAKGPHAVLAFRSTDGIGMQVLEDCSPTLKVGSGLDIPSPPAIYGFDPGQSSNPKTTDQMTHDASPPLPAGQGDAGRISVGGSMRPRKLTPRECERLQGFPDDWTRYADDNTEISDSQRYKMMGNAITVPVAEFLFKRIKDAD
tara:strand:- start:1078 stop:2316 length:1239 start_codon:yes stop_codon:yes gene_type:complete